MDRTTRTGYRLRNQYRIAGHRADRFIDRPSTERVALSLSRFALIFGSPEGAVTEVSGSGVGVTAGGSLLLLDPERTLGLIDDSGGFKPLLAECWQAVLSGDRKTVASVTQKDISLFDAHSGRVLSRLAYEGGTIRLDHDGRTLGLGRGPGIVELLEPGGRKLARLGVADPDPFEGLMVTWAPGHFSPTSDWRLLRDGRVLFKLRKDLLSVWRPEAEQPDWSVNLLDFADYTVSELKTSPDGSWAATMRQESGACHLVDLSTGEVRSLGEAARVSFSPDGSVLAALTGMEIRLWDTASGELFFTLDTSAAEVTDIEFTPDGLLSCLSVKEDLQTLLDFYEPFSFV